MFDCCYCDLQLNMPPAFREHPAFLFIIAILRSQCEFHKLQAASECQNSALK
jgi:hypothetical protein